MTDNDIKKETEDRLDEFIEPDTKAKFTQTLKNRAAEITSVRNDVYTTKWWQFVVNFLLGGGALACLIASMPTKGVVMTICACLGFALIVGLIVFNYLIHSLTPSSFLQYTYIDRERDKRYTFQILSRTRATYFDGERVVECNRNMAAEQGEPFFAQYRFDFFADMDVSVRITSGNRETYKGDFSCDGKTYKCKIVLVGDKPYYGSVGGCRIKYFDINNTKDKFVVPATLKQAAKTLGIPFPKLPGLHVRDDVACKDYSKQ